MKIYTTVEAVPSRMIAVARLLAATGPKPKDEVIALLQPGRDKTNLAENTLNAAIECKLVRREGDSFDLVPGVIPLGTKPDELDEVLPKTLARLLLQPTIDGEPNGFATLCAWLLQLPVENTPSNRGGLKAALKTSGFTLEELQIASDARWDNVIYWARYLGLVRQRFDEPCGGVVPDPTGYLRRHLSDLLLDGDDISAAVFRSRIGELCPVLDGGAARAAMLARVAPDWPADRLSDALTFALERLARTNELRWWCPNDQRIFLLTPAGKPIAFVAR
ncbi:MAG: hypothetical protein J0M04_19905 [Verrucomicrobia bacterium]|nr:hypothetical protein [Verrucomicrobiota bacterium]